MQIIQLDGVYTYMNNVKNLKIEDIVKLLPNKNNRINSKAIGAYVNNNKIGYIPYTIDQININNTYKIYKINLNKNNLQILISCNNDISNYIKYESEFIKKLIYNNTIIKTNLDQDILKFSKYLQRSNIIFSNIGITYYDDNFINILIENNIDEINNMFYTVTKKYYDNNIFKYDEFFCNNLITQQFFELFKIHRLDIYLIKNYSSIEKKIKSKNIKQKIIEDLNITIKKNILSNNIFHTNNIDIIKILILKEIKSSLVTNIELKNNYINLLNKNYFYDIFNNIEEGALYYNHNLKIYVEIDFIIDDTIIEINNNINNSLILQLLIKLIISNKNNIFIYNPDDNSITTINILEENKEKLLKLLK